MKRGCRVEVPVAPLMSSQLENVMKPLPILWKRLVKEGATCPRCGSTHENIVGAVKKLEAALQPLGIEPVLQTLAIDESTFQANPSESNRIWIAGKPLEEREAL